MSKPSEGGPRPSPAKDQRALQPYLKVQQASDRKIISILRSTLSSVNKELRKLKSRSNIAADIRRSQLNQFKVSLYQELAEAWRQIGDEVKAARADAAAAAVDSVSIYDRVLFGDIGKLSQYEGIVRGLKARVVNAIDLGSVRMTTSALQLSQNVYDSEALSKGWIDDILNQMLTRGASATEIAQAVSGFINPDTPGGVNYAALRLGRSELNRAFHASQTLVMKDSPWVTGTRWNLSGSHPAPDECDDYAAVGVYDAGDVPEIPHPFCLCFLTPVLMDGADFGSAYDSGAFDTFISSIA